jgi:hypothetical protein
MNNSARGNAIAWRLGTVLRNNIFINDQAGSIGYPLFVSFGWTRASTSSTLSYAGMRIIEVSRGGAAGRANTRAGFTRSKVAPGLCIGEGHG